MQRIKLYKRLLATIKSSWLPSPLNSTDQSLYDACEIVDDIFHMGSILLGTTGFPNSFKPLLNGIIAIPWTDDEIKNASIANTGCVFEVGVPYKKAAVKRDFEYFSDSLSCIGTKSLVGNTVDPYSDNIMSLIEKICISKKRQNQLLSLINAGSDNSFIIMYKPAILSPAVRSLDPNRLYNYAMLAYINEGGKLLYSDDLKRTGTSIFDSHLSFLNNIEYEQYLDIYDVMSEWQYAQDYLTSFMKMYQVMEFMAYRILLADLVSKNDIRHSFLRSVKNLDNSYSKTERETFVKQLSAIFNNFDSCKVLVTPSIESFVENHFAKDKEGKYLLQSQDTEKFAKSILKFIYDVRCSIVHNKESELHFTFNNFDVYKDLLALMKSIEDEVRRIIISTISYSNTPIKYNHSSLELF